MNPCTGKADAIGALTMLYGKSIQTVTAGDIEDLVTNGVREDRHLDYKQALPGPKDSDKKRFLADVSALANSAGGDIIYGVVEKRDVNGQATGVPDAIQGVQVSNIDPELRRLTSIIESGLDPGLIPKTEAVSLTMPTGSVVVVLRVPKSFAGPHMIKDSGRFYARHNSQNVPMDAATLRLAFASSDAWVDKVEKFRLQRLAKLMADELPVPVLAPERLVVHLVPFSAAAPNGGLDVLALNKLRPEPVGVPQSAIGMSWKFNLDGLCAFTAGDPAVTYTQFFRNGAVESVGFQGGLSGDRHVYLPGIEDDCLEAVRRYPQMLAGLGVSFPFALLITLLGAKGGKAVTGASFTTPKLVDRDDLLLANVLVDDANADPKVLLRETFNALWQACGYERSYSYTEDGAWKR